jgi:type II secretory pathway pseudopilin PulG
MQERGHTLVEMLVVAAIIMIVCATAVPTLRAYSSEAHLLGSARLFKDAFAEARSIAARSNVQTAIRFEPTPSGIAVSTYMDGNHNGVTAADIRRGIDRRIAGPTPLDSRAEGVRVGINAGVPAIPPDTGALDTADPIRFSADTVSFSPMGTATPGTFYLAGEYAQAAVRVVAGSARIRTLVCRKRTWVER